MADDEFAATVRSAVRDAFTSGKVSIPINSMDLLLSLIASKPTLSSSHPLRLTDLHRLESVLESLSSRSEHGNLSLSRGSGVLTITDVHLANTTADTVNPRKRKRPPVDEEADSAAGDDPDERSSRSLTHSPPPSATPLANLGKELGEVYAILQRATAKGRLMAERFCAPHESFCPVCSYITKEDCAKARREGSGATSSQSPICDRVHFKPLIRPHTDPSLGHCSYLNTCYSEPTYAQSPSIPPFPSGSATRVSLPSGLGAGGRGKEKAPCRYLHFEVDWDEKDVQAMSNDMGWKDTQRMRNPFKLEIGMGPDGKTMQTLPPQWINCDLRRFDYSVLGKFHVIMADPPWDIHMSLPYGTMTDDEMRAMPIPALQDEGLLFLWVTGRAMEVGRECLRVWGYTRVDEVVWVKTNQLQRVIRTGRTGHWLNHTKEHMLVGVKTHVDETGNLKFPSWVNRGLDTDVIVSEVRETSRKPDEVYGLIERMCPGGRKVEIFGRKHNTRPGWLTLGNQLGPDQIYEDDLASRIKARYPERLLGTPGV
ncbi:MT-A70-domain-containing protein [Boletus reticuloceps]|uniref:mRNA m(6)A methyltransferase n=1 Tax=Boletus reticuloceps TaxID=495285 RepID=A0A8I3ADK9_9AGAM|nr:MT-A70-domain-containing protein [Boletus reticuloceps]